MKKVVKEKVQRISEGNPPRVLDLFAGCGGISLGFHAAGFENVGGLEINKAAAMSHALNFHKDKSEKLFQIHSAPRDITEIEPNEILKKFGFNGDVSSAVDVVVGGPPCQAFARIGRAKLREIANHPEAFLQDSRSNLYIRYLDFVKSLVPVAIMMENVPDLLNYGGHNIAEEICETLDSWGYSVKYTILNAVFFGVPEMRERMFIVGYQKEISVSDWFPTPTHIIDLPRGYHGSRQVALKNIKTSFLDENKYYIDPPEPTLDLNNAITAEEALADLPIIDDDSEQKKKKGPRYFNKISLYRNEYTNDYQCMMRNWPGFEAGNGIYDHVIRYLPRDYKIFARMNAGDQYPQAFKLAEKMFREHLREIKAGEGKELCKGSVRYEEEKKRFIPPYDPGKFPNKWRKMEPDKPSRTLMAHLGKDSYSHIHYDSKQARTISVREAARLQSFPDGFVFQGPMNPAFKQIGNAVPPLMAKAMATVMLKQLTGAK